MLRQIIIPCYLLFLGCLPAAAQKLDHVRGELLVRLKPGAEPSRLAAELTQMGSTKTGLRPAQRISEALAVWTFTFDYTAIHEERLLAEIAHRPDVESVQFNHFIRLRSRIPNDVSFNQQWQYLNTGQSGGTIGADLDADLAWDHTTGGLTATGDTIVVCVLDDGVNLNHPDLAANLWRNHAEIPGNGIDDDQNGYVDDYRGWSTVSNTDNVSGGSHGTPIAGIIGAVGNNGIGVSGVNWKIKVMVVKNDNNTTEAKVLAAYNYPLTMRTRYNRTQGQSGAFVVATNSSWGIDNGRPEDSPIWCALFDTLGTQGILSCGATTNRNVNVDIDGDLPTQCPSEYLIAVTNLDHNDQKVFAAGYGAVSVDLGAYGNGVYTLDNNGGYSKGDGTSDATPHVTGAVGLLYSASCPALMVLSRADPAAAARLVRDAILRGAKPISALAGISTTGGKLNLNGAIQHLLSQCTDCVAPSSSNIDDIGAYAATVSWNVNESLRTVDLRYRALGSADWQVLTEVSSPLSLSGLSACRTYELQFRGICQSSTIDFGPSIIFRTDGCCEPPSDIHIVASSAGETVIGWSPVLAARSYVLRYRPAGTASWQERRTTGPTVNLNDLTACTRYEYQVQTDCDSTATPFSATQTLLTGGCGPCLELDYCLPQRLSARNEWIAAINLGGILVNTSASAPDGYADYSGQIDFPRLEQGAEYPITLTPAFSGQSFSESFKVWIDLDQNGTFTSNESVFESAASSDPAVGTLKLPATARLGVTRLRVAMQFLRVDTPCPFVESYGEIEDYCIKIVPTGSCVAPSRVEATPLDTSRIQLKWPATPAAGAYRLLYRQQGVSEWKTVIVGEDKVTLDNLRTCTGYEGQLASRCGENLSEEALLFTFTTACVNTTGEPSAPLERWRVRPNPFSETLTLEWMDDSLPADLRLSVFDLGGRRLWQGAWTEPLLYIATDHWAAGAYFLRLERPGERSQLRKVIKM